MKSNILFLLILLFCCGLNAQEYYTFNDKKMLTKRELDNKVLIFNKRANEVNSKKSTSILRTKYKILSTIKRNDSIIHKVTFAVSFESSRTEKLFSFENKQLPFFSLKNLDSKRITSNDMKGKVTFINLWFTQCYPCVKEIPLLNLLKKKYKNEVNFLAMTFDSKDKVKKFLKRKKFNFDHLVDGKYYLSKTLGNIGYPKIIILDKEGIVRYVDQGIPSEYDHKKRKMKERDANSLMYLEKIIDKYKDINN